MLIRHLSYLIALAKERHFARAAQSCNISQPALSAAIRQLEEELGVLLVERDKRFIGFTPEGQDVLLWARRIIADYESLKQATDSAKRELSGCLRLGVIPSALAAVPQVTAPLRARHPQLRIAVSSASAGEIDKGLHDFEYDAAIIYQEDAHQGLLQRPLYDEHLVLLAPEGLYQAGRAAVTWREAAVLPLCLLTQNMHNRRIIDGVFKALGHTPVPMVETNSFVTLIAQVAEGGLAAIVPKALVSLIAPPAGTRALELTDPEVNRAVALVVANRDPMPPMSLALFALDIDKYTP